MTRTLLAVDVGIRAGLALFGEDGRLRWYRSHNFGNRDRLRRGVYSILTEQPELGWLALEGGGPLAEVWARLATKREIVVLHTVAEAWRETFLLPRQRRTGAAAKTQAGVLARRVIDWAGAARPTTLRHDAAEAIMTGLWAAHRLGWPTPSADELA